MSSNELLPDPLQRAYQRAMAVGNSALKRMVMLSEKGDKTAASKAQDTSEHAFQVAHLLWDRLLARRTRR